MDAKLSGRSFADEQHNGRPACGSQAGAYYPRWNLIGTFMTDEQKNVFISHIHEDDATLQGLKDLLKRNGYEIRDGSIDSSKPNNAIDPDYIKSAILAPRIRWRAHSWS